MIECSKLCDTGQHGECQGCGCTCHPPKGSEVHLHDVETRMLSPGYAAPWAVRQGLA